MKKLIFTSQPLKQRTLNLFVFLLITFNMLFIINSYSQSDSIIVADRFGNYFPIESIRIPDAIQGFQGGGPVTCAAGIFNLVFTDPFNQGFNNNTNGNLYRDVACRVFTDLSQLIIPANNPYTGLPNLASFVNVNLHLYGGGNPFVAGQGTSFYNEQYAFILYNGATNNGLVDGEVWKTINGGFDSYFAFTNYYSVGQFFHGDVVINFSPGFTWNLDYTIPTPANDVDLYTVILHEAIHMLGFTSFLSSTGTSILAGTNFYTSYDSHLNIDNGNLIPILNNPFTCGTISYSGVTFSSGCNTRFLGTNNEPVSPGSPYVGGGSFSHFEENCPPNTPYVMSNGGAPGTTRRHPTQEDVYALCDLHYHTTAVYGISGTGYDNYLNTYIGCGNRVAGVDDIFHFGTSNLYIYTDCVGQPPIAMTDFLSNDEDESSATGHPVSYDCLRIIRGNGVVSSPTATTFNYQTLPGFNGWSILRYIPVGQNGQRGNLTYIYILTVPCSNCNNTACNYVEFGDFEAINNSNVLPLSNFRITLNNSPDLFGWNGSNWVFNPANGISTIWGSTCSGTNVTIPPSWSGVGNNRYAGFASVAFNGVGNNVEGLTFRLCNPLIAGNQYTLSFYASILSSQCPGELHFYTSEYAPCLPGLGATNFALANNCSGTVPLFNYTEIVTPQIINNVVPNWTLYTVAFTYNPVVGTPNANYLTLGLTTGNYPSFPYIFVDDIAISCSPDITETIINPCAGQCNGSIDLTINGCSPPYSFAWSTTATTEDLTNLCPGTYTVTVTDANGCTNTKTYVLTDSQCNDFTIDKSANYSSTYAGQPVTFTVTACNYTGSPQPVTITDALPLYFVPITNPFPFPFNGSLPASPPCTTFTYTGYFTNVGSCPDPNLTNTVTMATPNGPISDDECVNILQGCPMIVYGNSDCVVGNAVSVCIGVHTTITQVTGLDLTIVYPSFIDPPASLGPGNTFENFGGANFVFGVGQTEIVSTSFYGLISGVPYNQSLIHIRYNNPVNVSPPYQFACIDFIYTNIPARPLGQNSFLCWAIAPAGGPYHTDIYQNGVQTLSPWTQGYHVFFTGCPDAPQLDASFDISQTPCTGIVNVTANYVSATAIHIWNFGDGRSTPVNGTQSYPWDYYNSYTDNFGVTQPGLTPGNYTFTITHTVIDNGIATTSTQEVVLYPPCCQQTVTIHDGDRSSMFGSFLSGTDVDIEGEFIIDQTFVFTNCTVKMEPASKITVQSPNTLRIDQSTIESCSNMWQGIYIENGATCVSTVSAINDAQYAIYAVDGATFGLYASTFDRNYVTIEIPQSPNPPYFNTVYHVIDDCTFDCTSNLRPAFTGQSPAPGTISFAAVDAWEVDLDFSGLGSNQNHFQNLSNGIVGSQCNFYVVNCDFHRIQRDPAYNSNIYNGSGIYLRGGHGFFSLRQTGYGISGIPSFERCYRAIYTERVNVSSTDNRMTDMQFGYRVDYGGYMNIDILNNYIRSNYYGVDLRMNDNARHLLVEGNRIHFGLIGQLAKGVSAINVMEQNGLNPDSKINSNYIWHVPGASNAVNGINMTSASNYQVTGNEVHLADNLANQKGITTQSCMNDEVSCNTVTGPGTNYDLALKDQSAIKVDMGDYHNVSCNTVDGTRNGVFFSGYSYNTDVKGNNINYHKYGLHLDNFSIIGTQKWKGNKWYNTPSTGGFGAWYENTGNANIYKFIYDNINSPGAIAEPPSWDPIYWFNFIPNQNFECNPQSGPDYCSQFNFVSCHGCDHDFDLDIAQQLIQNGDFTDPSRYELAKKLWKVLDENQAYRDSFPVLDSFYVANQNGFIDLINTVAETASNLHDIDSTVQQELENNKTQLEALVQSLKTNVAVLLDANSTPALKAAAAAAIPGIKSNILSLIDYDKTAIDLASSSKTLSADNISLVNASLATNEIFEQNEKQVNELYLTTIAKGITTFDAIQTPSLLNIAQQCPLAGGNAVYKARAMYSLIDDDLVYDDPAACLNAGVILRHAATGNNSQIKSAVEAPVSIHPNPATDKATLVYKLPDENNGVLILTDVFGKEIFRSVLVSNSTAFTFSTANFTQSVYFYRVFSNDKLIGSGKLSIIK